MVTPESQIARPTQQNTEATVFVQPMVNPGDNASYTAAMDRMRTTSCGNPESNSMLNSLGRPAVSEAGLSQGQRSDLSNEANRVASAIKAAGDLSKATPQQIAELNKVLDHPNTSVSVKLNGMPEHRDKDAPRSRCPSAASVTFPPPAMDGSYKMVEGKLHIINSKGGYTPFDSVMERLRGR